MGSMCDGSTERCFEAVIFGLDVKRLTDVDLAVPSWETQAPYARAKEKD